ncbi:MAG: altronate oxidoreductase, partial [Bacteroidota bacterium]
GLGYLSGFNLTREAVTDKTFSVFAKNLMHMEIAKAIPYEIDEKVKTDFANKVFERFCNPFIDHQWLSITVQYTSKMKMRNMPLFSRHYELNDTPPMHMATGFAGFLLYMKATRKDGHKYFGERNGPDSHREEYEIKDDSAEYFFNAWQNTTTPDAVAEAVMKDEALWDMDLTKLPGLLSTVQEQLQYMIANGVLETISQLKTKKATV